MLRHREQAEPAGSSGGRRQASFGTDDGQIIPRNDPIYQAAYQEKREALRGASDEAILAAKEHDYAEYRNLRHDSDLSEFYRIKLKAYADACDDALAERANDGRPVHLVKPGIPDTSQSATVPDSRSLNNQESGMKKSPLVRVWERKEPAARNYAVAELVPEGCVSSFYGDGGTGKSLVIGHMCTCIPLGEKWLGLEVRQQPVLYLDAELDEEEFLRRAYAIARGMGHDRPPKNLHYLRLPGSLVNPDTIAVVEDAIHESGATFIVIDSLMAATYGGDLERATDTTATMKAISAWGTVLLIDHIPKPQPGANLSQYRQYGSVFKFNLSRSVIQAVQADGGGLLLRQTKHNFGPKAAPLGVDVGFEDGKVTFRAVESSDKSLSGIDDHLPALERVHRALAAEENAAAPESLAEQLDMSAKTVRNHLTTLRQQKRAEPAGDGRWAVIRRVSESQDANVPDSRLLRDREREPGGTYALCQLCGRLLPNAAARAAGVHRECADEYEALLQAENGAA